MLSKLFFSTTLFALVITAPLAAQAGKYETTIRAAYDALNRKDWNAFAALCDEKKYTDVNVAPVTTVGVWEALEGYKQFFNAFTDFKIAVNEIATISPTRYLVRVTLSGKHTGSLMGIPATGKTMKYDDVDVIELNAQGKCIYHEATKGGTEVFRQLGVDPIAAMHEANIRAMLVAADEGSVDKFMSYWAPGAINYFAGKQTSDDDLRKRIGGMKSAFPDIKRTLDEVVVSGRHVTVKGWVTGTNKGTYQGQAPTGNSVKVAWLGLYKLNAEGKIQEGTVEFDTDVLNSQVKGFAPGATAANKQVVLKIMETLNKHDLNAVGAAFAPGCRFHGWTPQPEDVNGYKKAMSGLLASFPDGRFIVDDVVAAGDKVVVRHHFEGTHTGAAFQGTPKSNKSAMAAATVTFQMKDGKPVELWLNADFLALLMQIGAIPASNQ